MVIHGGMMLPVNSRALIIRNDSRPCAEIETALYDAATIQGFRHYVVYYITLLPLTNT